MVDGTWTTDHTAPQETDDANNLNNVLTPDKISKPTSSIMSNPSSNFISGVTPQSTTAALAGQVPKESERGQENKTASSDLPGSFPETPGPNEMAEYGVKPIPASSGIGNPVHLEPGEKVPDTSTINDNTISSTAQDDPTLKSADKEESSFGVSPLPATSGIGNPVHLQPGEKVPHPSTFTDNTISSTAQDDPTLKSADKEESSFGVSPLPATSGIGNPIHLQPGEKVPHPSTFTDNTIQSTVKLDKESYEKGDAIPQLPNVVTPSNERQGDMFSVPGISGTMIPESSLPMGGGSTSEKDPGFTIQSAGPGSTTAGLAADVPLEPKGVPEVVQESQPIGGGSTSKKDPDFTIQSAGPGSTTAALAADVPLEPRGVPEEVQERRPLGGGSTSEKDPGSTIQSAGPGSTTAALAADVPLEPRGVPEVVQESQQEAGVAPEASGNREAVKEKSAVEKELESKVPEEPATSESATASAFDTGSRNTSSMPSRALPSSIQQSIDDMNKGTAIAPTVPDVVQESITQSNQAPEAAADKGMVQEKANVEAELLKGQAPDESVGEPAPSTTAAMAESAPAATSSAQPDATTPAPITDKTATPQAPTVNEPTGATATSKEPSASAITDPRSITSTDPATAAKTDAPASTSKGTPALTPVAENAKQRDVSRSVSPMTRTGQASSGQPAVTSGVGESSAPTQSKAAAPVSSSSKNSTSPAASSSTDKKSKRASGFFGKLKSKFSDKDKDKK